jgi:hypothetical protein
VQAHRAERLKEDPNGKKISKRLEEACKVHEAREVAFECRLPACLKQYARKEGMFKGLRCLMPQLFFSSVFAGLTDPGAAARLIFETSRGEKH